MTRYMVVTADGRAQFFDSYKEAQAYAYNAECLVELYEYEIGEGYIRIA